MRLWDVERHAARRGPRLEGTRRDLAYARFNGPDVSVTQWTLDTGTYARTNALPRTQKDRYAVSVQRVNET